MTNSKNMPGLVVAGAALVSFVVALAAFAMSHPLVGIVFAVLAGTGFVIGGGWVLVEHQRVRHIERRWYAEHPDATVQPPNS